MTDQTQTTTEPVAWIDGEDLDCLAQGNLLTTTLYPVDDPAARTPLYTTPQPLSVGLDREAVARVIDPEAWYVADGDAAHPDTQVQASAKKTVAPSLVKADAILALAAPAEGWQGIETAPKDGTRIILTGDLFGPKVDVGSWGSATYDRSARVYNEGWVTNPGHAVYPTHWMPLPAAPTGGRS